MSVLLGLLVYVFWGYVLWRAYPAVRADVSRLVSSRRSARGRYSSRGGDL